MKDLGNMSDGYHTFNELYAHRVALFIALALSHKALAWRAAYHSDGTRLDGWFIAGLDLPTGAITYHLPDSDWPKLDGVRTLTNAPDWDGHTAADVVDRLAVWAEQL